jgi:hypothetical protein
LVVEHIDGEPLAGPMPVAQALPIAAELRIPWTPLTAKAFFIAISNWRTQR